MVGVSAMSLIPEAEVHAAGQLAASGAVTPAGTLVEQVFPLGRDLFHIGFHGYTTRCLSFSDTEQGELCRLINVGLMLLRREAGYGDGGWSAGGDAGSLVAPRRSRALWFAAFIRAEQGDAAALAEAAMCVQASVEDVPSMRPAASRRIEARRQLLDLSLKWARR